ncbi:Type I restriction modification DNA specificity domain-containing protein [Rubritalea squalenifaciens DSM 18772]|uniref:Type I restriction modification DNA specificity domain-containing protein n=1 Tax=Rubritalea squalenifaciens DSM 18772 TaxID=1123071 RepID=A0A1M6GTM7_9BACT|nr:restriction endonuclease subunit S [Rubritalea squalenifaciens]SHJ13313.1 Type I restriction modification DNA specificity domain-containing protein [Rubritalea squalenifaciens DSM 18772]
MSKWPVKTLKEVCTAFQYGSSSKSESKGEIPVLRMGNLQDGEIIWGDLKFSSDLDEIKKYQLVKNDVLFNRTNSAELVGKAALFNGARPAIHAGYLIRVQTNSELLNATYLNYFLNCATTRAHGFSVMSKSVNQANINASKLKEYKIPVPPLSEQERIVAILDEAFESIATAIAHTERKLHNARELFQSTLQSTFQKIGEDWPETTLGEICKFTGGSQPPKSEFHKDPAPERVRLIQIRDYKSDKHIVYVDKDKVRRFCSTDDVMIGRYGPPIFQILRGLEGAYNVALIKAIPDERRISKDFLAAFLRTPAMYAYVEKASSRAAGQSGVNKNALNPYPIHLPSLHMQNLVVAKLDMISDETHQLEQLYQKQLNSYAELKQSLLHQAFSGKL